MATSPQQRRAARHAQPTPSPAPPARQSLPLTVERITAAALEIVASQGYAALTMRSVASALDTGPASLYAHVVNKSDLDELIIGRLCAQLVLPEPDPPRWRDQIVAVCTQLRDLYLTYPGISQAALAIVPTNLDVLRIAEGMLAILLAGGIEPQTAAWAIDAFFLYVNAYTLETALLSQRRSQANDEWLVDHGGRDELVRRFTALPADRFPQTRRYARELTAGKGHERFDFTLGLMLDNLTRRRTSPSIQRGRR